MSYIAQLIGVDIQKVRLGILATFIYAMKTALIFLAYYNWREIKGMAFWLATLPGAEHAPFVIVCFAALFVGCWVVDIAAKQKE